MRPTNARAGSRASERFVDASISGPQPIPSRFRHDGFNLTLLKRIGDVAMFSKTKPWHSRDSFEVVILRRHPAKWISGRFYPHRESLPPTESWGTQGWSCVGLLNAECRFEWLVKRQQEARLQGPPTAVDAFCCVGSAKTAGVVG